MLSLTEVQTILFYKLYTHWIHEWSLGIFTIRMAGGLLEDYNMHKSHIFITFRWLILGSDCFLVYWELIRSQLDDAIKFYVATND
jgi:hypothetical protein